MSENPKFTLSSQELQSAEFYSNDRQTILKILKDKGAPVDGVMFFTLKSGYTVLKESNPFDGSMTFEFIKQKKSTHP